MIHGDKNDAQVKEFHSCQQVVQQEQVDLNGSARYVVALYIWHTEEPMAYSTVFGHLGTVGHGFCQNFVIGTQKQYLSLVLNVTKISLL